MPNQTYADLFFSAPTQPKSLPEDQPHVPVIVSVGERRIYFGWVAASTPLDMDRVLLRDSRRVMRWSTAGGIAQLAVTGPTKDTRMDAACTCYVRDIRVVRPTSADAAAAMAGL